MRTAATRSNACQNAVADEERLVALAAEVAHLAAQPEQVGRDSRDLVGGEARRRRLEDVQGLGDSHGLILCVRIGHLVDRRSREQRGQVRWRRRRATPEIPLSQEDVDAIFRTLFRIQWLVTAIWAAVVGGDVDGEDEP